MARGRVNWYSPQLGYGFIVPEDGGAEVFVLRKDLPGNGEYEELENSAEVTYEVVQGEEGPEARSVSKTREPVGR
jgi:CspA family cold shock protein